MKFQLNKNTISLLVAVGLGILTVVLVNIYLAKEKDTLRKRTEQQLGGEVTVVVAKRDIGRGTKITRAMLEMAGVRESALQPRAISTLAGAIGKVAIADILSGEQVSSTKLMSGAYKQTRERPSTTGFSHLAPKIPLGKRAFTISIDAISAAGGMIRPNDYVDVMGMFPFTQSLEGKPVAQNVSVTLFQNVLVLAVGQDISVEPAASGKAARGASTVTLALTPQQVELFNFAQDLGKLRLVLRPPLETNIQAIPPITAAELYQYIASQAGMQLPAEGVKEGISPKEPMQTVEIYRGKVKEVVPLQ